MRGKHNIPRGLGQSVCAASISDRETVDVVTNDQMATHAYQVLNLTLLNETELFLNELDSQWQSLPTNAPDQRALMERMLDLGLYGKLAEFVLLEDANQMQSRFHFTEKGALKNSLDLRLQEQLTVRIRRILQALNHYSSKGARADEEDPSEQRGILRRIREEHDFVDGIEAVYQALMQMQTIVAIGIQADSRSNHFETEAIEETKFKIESDICRRRTILNALDYITRTGWLILMTKYKEDLVDVF